MEPAAGGGPGVHADEVLRRRRGVLDRRLGADVLVLAPDTDEPVLLGGAAAALWEALATPRCLEEATTLLAGGGSAPVPGEVRVHLADAATTLVAAGLVEPVGDPAAVRGGARRR